MGQSVKDAFGIDMSGITVAALESDAGLREHLFMACLAEMSSRGSVDALEDTPDAVYACAKGLFGGVGADKGLDMDTFFRVVTKSRHYETHRDFYGWLCGFLRYVGGRLGVTVLPKYVDAGWFFRKADAMWGVLDCVSNAGALSYFDAFEFKSRVISLLGSKSAADYDCVFRHACYKGYRYILTGGCAESLTGVEWSKLCLGCDGFRQVELAFRHIDCCGTVYSPPMIGVDTKKSFSHCLRRVHDGDDFLCGVHFFIELFFNCFLIEWKYSSVLDVELLSVLKSFREDLDSVGVCAESPRLFIYCLDSRMLFLKSAFSEFREDLRKCGADFVWFPWSCIPKKYFYDADELTALVKLQLSVEDSPVGLFSVEALSHFGGFRHPLMGWRRITMDMFNRFYPEGLRAYIKKNFMGHPFVVCLEGLGVYFVVDDYFFILDSFLVYPVKNVVSDYSPLGDDFIVREGSVSFDDLLHFPRWYGSRVCKFMVGDATSFISNGVYWSDDHLYSVGKCDIDPSVYDECITFKGDMSVFDKYYS